MHSFIQRNKKKLLAIFGVVLMIAFVIPTVGLRNGNDRSGVAAGKAFDGKVELTQGDLDRARQDLAELRQILFLPLLALDPTSPSRPDQAGAIGKALSENPELYVLLQKEAEAAGVAPSPESVDAVHRLYVELYQDQYARRSAQNDPAKYKAARADAIQMQAASDELREVVRRFLLVRDNFQRAASLARVTPSVVDERVARDQVPFVNVVEFNAADSKPAPPTDEEVLKVYNEFGDKRPNSLPAGMPNDANHAGARSTAPGYRLPDRAKLQYLKLSGDAVLDAVVAKLPPAELVALNELSTIYYTNNQSEFQTTPPPAPATAPTSSPSTAPSTPPTTGPATAPSTTGPATTGPSTTTTSPATAPATAPAATKPAVAAGPTTRPLGDVLPEVYRKILRDQARQVKYNSDSPAETERIAALLTEVAPLQAKVRQATTRIESDLRGKLAEHYALYVVGRPLSFDFAAPAAPTTSPTTSPTTAPATGPATTNPSTTAPATAPAAPAVAAAADTRPSEFYASTDYLTAFADAFEKAHGVRPMLTQLANDWYTREKLAAEPGIGAATTLGTVEFAAVALQTRPPEPDPATLKLGPDLPADAGPTTAPATAPTTGPAATQPAASQPATKPATTQPLKPTATTKPARPTLALLEPSPELTDDRQNRYVFRLTAFDGGRAPAFEDVREEIRKDLAKRAEYAKAREEAQALVRAVNATSDRPLGRIPVQPYYGEKSVVAGPVLPPEGDMMFMRQSAPPIVGYPPPLPEKPTPEQQATYEATSDQLRKYGTDLARLAERNPSVPHPAAVLELPDQRKVLVVELRELRRRWFQDEDAARQQQYAADARAEAARAMAGKWFDPKDIRDRTRYAAAK